MTKLTGLWLLHLTAFVLMPLMTFAADVPAQLPKSDGRPAQQTKPIKVYIMMGQSNMLGFGRVGPKETKGSLEFLVKEKGKYPHLVNDSGNWITRQDVRYVHVMDQRGVDYKDMEKGHHYNHNAETYYETGDRLGRAMATLLQGN